MEIYIKKKSLQCLMLAIRFKKHIPVDTVFSNYIFYIHTGNVFSFMMDYVKI